MTDRPTVHLGDCLAWLRAMPDESAQAAIFDPPYCSGDWQESKSVRRISDGSNEGERSWFAADSMGTAGVVWLLRSVMIELHRVLVPGSHVITFAHWRVALTLAPALESSGMRLQNWVTWDKETAGLGEHFRRQTDTVLHYCKGVGRRCEWAGRFGDVLRAPRVHHTARLHPTEKPIGLLEQIVRVVSNPGDIVLDPFAGTAPLGVACALVGRRYAGAEVDPVYHAAAARRLGDVVVVDPSHQLGLDLAADVGGREP